MFVIPLRVPFLSPTCESSRARPSSIRLLLMSLGLFVLRGVHLSVSVFVILLRVPFLSPTCESLYCASFIYLFPMFVILLRGHCLFVLRAFCLVVNRGRRGEERVSDSLASWEDKRIDVVASSWRYFSTQSIISLHTPTFHTSIDRRCDRPE
jgi:hypothetical protein